MRTRNGYRSILCQGAGLAVIVVGVGSQPAKALDIVLEYNSAASDNPAYDPDGSRLASVLESAAALYEDIIEDVHTLTIRYWWEDLPSGVLGVHQGTSHNGQRELRANLRFDTTEPDGDDRRWFIDPSPQINSEFNMQQTVVGDLTDPSKAFRGDPPDQFEVGYRGTALSSAPSSARNGFDLLTVALHEIGHGLGVPAPSSADDETDDGDWDTPPQLLGGTSIGIRTAGDSDQGPFHTKAGSSLMSPSVSKGLRKLPSATDIFAMASTANWTQIDMPRKDFLGSGVGGVDDWGLASNWIGNRVPDIDDDVNLRHSGSHVSLGAQAFAGNLTVEGALQLRTQGQLLTVAGQTHLDAGAGLVVGDTSDPAAVGAGAGLVTDSLVLGAEGHALTLAGGRLSVLADSIALGASDTLAGMGALEATVVSSGVISPGLPTGLLSIEGDLTLEGGQIEIEISPGGHDQISVSGGLTLGGQLGVSLIDSFVPTPGQVFDILLAGDISDSFEAIGGDVFRLDDGQTALVPMIDPQEGVVSLVATLVGDINGDMRVEFADFAILESHFNSPGDWFDGDLSGDGVVNFLDFTLLQSNYGRSLLDGLESPGSIPGALLIPVPGTGFTLLWVMALLVKRGRRSIAFAGTVKQFSSGHKPGQQLVID